MKYFIITFGCQMNKSDSERIINLLEKNSYTKTSKMYSADLILVNMCSVRQSAVNRIYGLLPKLKEIRKENKNLKTLLTGCILKKDLKKLKNEFDFILNIKTLSMWPQILEKEGYIFYPDQRQSEFNEEFNINYFKVKPKPLNKFLAFIPISVGCNNFCAYCVVPHTRGPLICRSHKSILREMETSLKKGAKEIWLLGQNVNDYLSPIDSSINFSKLLKMVNEIPGYFWLRFTSSHPKDFSEELINVLANSEKVTEYLNLPIQSGDNEILKRMNRPYTVEQYKELVRKIREKIPNIALSTDIIVGFPGETREQFHNTLSLIKNIKYDMAFIAKYSPRSQTPAFKLKDSVPQKEKRRRYQELTKAMEKIALEKNKKYVDKETEVLILDRVNEKRGSFYLGRTRNNKTVKVEPSDFKSRDLLGQFLKIKITHVSPWGLLKKSK